MKINLIDSKRQSLSVVDNKGAKIGEIERYLIDPHMGRIAFAIVSRVNKRVAVPMDILKWSDDSKTFKLDVPLHVFEEAPSIAGTATPEEVDVEWLNEVYECVGCRPYWTGWEAWRKRPGSRS